MPKPPQPLNHLQTEVLLILYKFRFATRDLIVTYQELPSRTYTGVRLTNLMKQGYIARRYTGKDKLAGIPARYYLANKGIKFLLNKKILENYGLNPKMLNLIYKDKQASEQFIEDRLDIFKLYVIFTKHYGNALDFYTRSEIAEYDFLKPLPEAYIMLRDNKKSKQHNTTTDYIIEIMKTYKPYFTQRRRINQYIKQFQLNSWQEQISTNNPTLLFVLNDSNLERRIQRSIAFSLRSRGITGLNIYTANLKSLLGSTETNIAVWSSPSAPNKLYSLEALSVNS